MSNGVFASLYIPSVSCGYDYNSLMPQKYKFHIICQCQKHSTVLFIRGVLSKTLLQKMDTGFSTTNVLQKGKLFCTHCITSFFNLIDTIGLTFLIPCIFWLAWYSSQFQIHYYFDMLQTSDFIYNTEMSIF